MRYANLASQFTVKDFLKFYETRDVLLTLLLRRLYDFCSTQNYESFVCDKIRQSH